jgi:hypothetical protein
MNKKTSKVCKAQRKLKVKKLRYTMLEAALLTLTQGAILYLIMG